MYRVFGSVQGSQQGHVRSAQELANAFYRRPSLLGAYVKTQIFEKGIDANIKELTGKTGLIFIKNGWGSTNHIDLWNGRSKQLKGASNTQAYMKVGQQIWFWELR